MLTSKPPFQSSTTDEIYRRAKDRDYEWPSSETSQKYISQEAKDLVATMLQDADRRPDPDTIVAHPFFTSGYMPLATDITYKLRELPPDNAAFYEPLANSQAHVLNLQNVQEMCRECGVGPWCQSQLVFRNIWREMAEEEQNGLTPVIPLAEGVVYRPFDEIKNEQKLQARLAAEQLAKQASQLSLSDKPRDLKESTQAQKPSSGLLRAPPQSFAAQQRAQHRPTTTTTTISQSKTVSEPISRASAAPRPRSGRETPTASVQPTDEEVPVSKTSTRSTRNQAVTSTRSQPTVGSEDPAPRPRRSASTREKRQEERLSLFSPTECQEAVPGSQPDVVLERLQRLQAELERALNTRTMALVSSRDKTPPAPHIVVKWVDYTNKFGLGYVLNDGSVGCILRSIPSSDVSNPGKLPPAYLLVHDAERHFMRRDDPNYKARHQIVPMKEGIFFYENNGENGISRVRVAPENFMLPVNPDGTVGKLSAGKDIYDHRKRERIVLWKKFANYMMAYGREMESPEQTDEVAIRIPTITDTSAAPPDVVTFYQRFGDVGCWMFSDGHMQVRRSLDGPTFWFSCLYIP
jgi:hypothetical protein